MLFRLTIHFCESADYLRALSLLRAYRATVGCSARVSAFEAEWSLLCTGATAQTIAHDLVHSSIARTAVIQRLDA